MYRERVRTVGVSLLGGNSGVEGSFELGIDCIRAVNEEDVTTEPSWSSDFFPNMHYSQSPHGLVQKKNLQKVHNGKGSRCNGRSEYLRERTVQSLSMSLYSHYSTLFTRQMDTTSHTFRLRTQPCSNGTSI